MGFSDQIFWFTTRSAGIISWFAASLSIMAGLLLSSRFLGRKPTIPYLTDIHRFLGGLSVFYLVIHMITLAFDEFIQFGVADLLIPGVASIPGFSRFALALGVIAAWLMIIIEVTSLLKKHMPKQVWHGIHLSSFLVLIMGTWHGVDVGAESGNRLMLALGSSLTAAVVLVTGVRAYRVWVKPRPDLDEPASSPIEIVHQPESRPVRPAMASPVLGHQLSPQYGVTGHEQPSFSPPVNRYQPAPNSGFGGPQAIHTQTGVDGGFPQPRHQRPAAQNPPPQPATPHRAPQPQPPRIAPPPSRPDSYEAPQRHPDQPAPPLGPPARPHQQAPSRPVHPQQPTRRPVPPPQPQRGQPAPAAGPFSDDGFPAASHEAPPRGYWSNESAGRPPAEPPARGVPRNGAAPQRNEPPRRRRDDSFDDHDFFSGGEPTWQDGTSGG